MKNDETIRRTIRTSQKVRERKSFERPTDRQQKRESTEADETKTDGRRERKRSECVSLVRASEQRDQSRDQEQEGEQQQQQQQRSFSINIRFSRMSVVRVSLSGAHQHNFVLQQSSSATKEHY